MKKPNHSIVIIWIGVNRISKDSANPKEAKLMDNRFIKIIKTISTRKNINFRLDSYSTSYYAVKSGKTKKEDLNHWLKTNL